MGSIAMMSMAMLMFELLQTVVLSLQIWQQNAFLVVSLSLLGLGAGGSFATWLQHRWINRPFVWLWSSAGAFAVALVLSVLICCRTHDLLGLIFASLVPYVFVGIYLSIVFLYWPEKANQNYFCNLAGSGLGCLALVWVLDGLGDAGATVLAMAQLALLSAFLIARAFSRRRMWGSIVGIIFLGFLFPFTDILFPFSPHETKRYGEILKNESIESRLDWSQWGYLGRLDSVEPGEGVERFGYLRFARRLQKEGADFRFLFVNGGNWTYCINFKGNDELQKRYARGSIVSLPYFFHKNPVVLNIGPGGGNDVFLALQHNAESVIGVEINPLMIEAVAERHRGYFEDAYRDPRVTILEMDGRTFVDNTDRQFDVVTLTAVDTGAGLAAGANILSENYLYTQEAFDRYFEILKDNGFLFVFRPGREIKRCIVTATHSLRKMGVEHPERHIIVLGSLPDNPWTAALISRQEFAREQLELLEQRLARGDFSAKPYYLPGSETEYDFMQPFFELMGRGEESKYLEQAALDYRPVSDNAPYFYNFSRRFLGSQAGALLLRILACVSVIGALLIFMPLAGLRQTGHPRRVFSTLAYFAGIGAGFMFIEICLIQKLALYLGHPAYSITVTLFTILVFAGVGSIASSRLGSQVQPVHAAIFIGIIAVVLGYSFGLDRILSAIHPNSLFLRSLVVVAILAPGSFFMGMPFPTMIRALGDQEADLIPWAWAVNAFASVAASVMSVMLAMSLGFFSLFLLGAACYLMTLFIYLHRAVRTVKVAAESATAAP